MLLKIILTSIIVNVAKEQNRDTISWGFFGFFITGLALIIIGFLPKIKDKLPTRSVDDYSPAPIEEEEISPTIEIIKNVLVKEGRNFLDGSYKKYEVEFEDGLTGYYFELIKRDVFMHRTRGIDSTHKKLSECLNSLHNYLSKES
jgi:hypothetical protein